MSKKVRDLFSEEDEEQIKKYEQKILNSRTPLGVYINHKKVINLIKQVKGKYEKDLSDGGKKE
jgi:hypothetical protein